MELKQNYKAADWSQHVNGVNMFDFLSRIKGGTCKNYPDAE